MGGHRLQWNKIIQVRQTEAWTPVKAMTSQTSGLFPKEARHQTLVII